MKIFDKIKRKCSSTHSQGINASRYGNTMKTQIPNTNCTLCVQVPLKSSGAVPRYQNVVVVRPGKTTIRELLNELCTHYSLSSNLYMMVTVLPYKHCQLATTTSQGNMLTPNGSSFDKSEIVQDRSVSYNCNNTGLQAPFTNNILDSYYECEYQLCSNSDLLTSLPFDVLRLVKLSELSAGKNKVNSTCNPNVPISSIIDRQNPVKDMAMKYPARPSSNIYDVYGRNEVLANEIHSADIGKSSCSLDRPCSEHIYQNTIVIDDNRNKSLDRDHGDHRDHSFLTDQMNHSLSSMDGSLHTKVKRNKPFVNLFKKKRIPEQSGKLNSQTRAYSDIDLRNVGCPNNLLLSCDSSSRLSNLSESTTTILQSNCLSPTVIDHRYQPSQTPANPKQQQQQQNVPIVVKTRPISMLLPSSNVEALQNTDTMIPNTDHVELKGTLSNEMSGDKSKRLSAGEQNLKSASETDKSQQTAPKSHQQTMKQYYASNSPKLTASKISSSLSDLPETSKPLLVVKERSNKPVTKGNKVKSSLQNDSQHYASDVNIKSDELHSINKVIELEITDKNGNHKQLCHTNSLNVDSGLQQKDLNLTKQSVRYESEADCKSECSSKTEFTAEELFTSFDEVIAEGQKSLHDSVDSILLPRTPSINLPNHTQDILINDSQSNNVYKSLTEKGAETDDKQVTKNVGEVYLTKLKYELAYWQDMLKENENFTANSKIFAGLSKMALNTKHLPVCGISHCNSNSNNIKSSQTNGKAKSNDTEICVHNLLLSQIRIQRQLLQHFQNNIEILKKQIEDSTKKSNLFKYSSAIDATLSSKSSNVIINPTAGSSVAVNRTTIVTSESILRKKNHVS